MAQAAIGRMAYIGINHKFPCRIHDQEEQAAKATEDDYGLMTICVP